VRKRQAGVSVRRSRGAQHDDGSAQTVVNGGAAKAVRRLRLASGGGIKATGLQLAAVQCLRPTQIQYGALIHGHSSVNVDGRHITDFC
jgi:hypothetical protein